MLSFQYNRTSNVFVDVNVSEMNHNFKFLLILGKCIILIVLQKLKFMQEFTFAINVAKLLMHNCARAKNAKTSFCSILINLKAQSSGK